MSILKNVVVRKARVVRQNSPLEDLADYDICTVELDDSADEKYKIRKIFQMSYPKVAADPTFVLSSEQRKAGFAISNCKTGKVGFVASECEKCGKVVLHTASCNNRNCPNCQAIEEKIWVQKRKAEVIEGVIYHHSVVTIPSELYSLVSANQEILYKAMNKYGPGAIVDLCKNNYGFTPGVISIFHSWKSNLGYHPHVHMAFTCGGLTKDNKFICPETKKLKSGEHFFLPESLIAQRFKSLFMTQLNIEYKAGHLSIPSPDKCEGRNLTDPFQWKDFVDHLYKMKWIAYSKETFNGHGDAIEYFGRYSNRTAISNNRIESVLYDEDHPDGEVRFWYKDYKDHSKKKIRTVTGVEFVKLFLAHVLPENFIRIRYSGIYSNSVKKKNLKHIANLRSSTYKESAFQLISAAAAVAVLFPDLKPKVCPCCGGNLKMLGRVYGRELDVYYIPPKAG